MLGSTRLTLACTALALGATLAIGAAMPLYLAHQAPSDANREVAIDAEANAAAPRQPAERAASPTSAASARLATVDTLRIVRGIMSSTDYAEERQDLREELMPQVQALEQTLQRLATEYENADPSDPGLRQKQAQYQQTLQQYQQVTQQANTRLNQRSAEQALRAFRTVRDETQALADELGYTHVLNATARYDEMGAGNSNAAMQEILARQVLVWPESDDLTERVMDRLGVEDPSEPQEVPAPGGASIMPAPDDADQSQNAGPGEPTDSGEGDPEGEDDDG